MNFKRRPSKRTALLWASAQRAVVIPNRLFGTAYWSHLQGSRLPLYAA